MVETIYKDSEQVMRRMELQAWRDSADELDSTRMEISRLMGLQNLAATKQNELTQNFLDRFSSTLVTIKPNMFVMIKPSRRQNITSAFPPLSSMPFNSMWFHRNDGSNVILTELVDYRIIDFSPSKTWCTNGLDEHSDWLIEVMAELDESEQRI